MSGRWNRALAVCTGKGPRTWVDTDAASRVFSLDPRCQGLLRSQVDPHTGLDGERHVLGHLLALVPGDGTPELSRQCQDPLGHSFADWLGPMSVGELLRAPRLSLHVLVNIAEE